MKLVSLNPHHLELTGVGVWPFSESLTGIPLIWAKGAHTMLNRTPASSLVIGRTEGRCLGDSYILGCLSYTHIPHPHLK